MSSESAAAAVGYAPRSGDPMYEYISALSVRYTRSVEPTTARRQAGSPSQTEGFDPGSERTLAAWLRHASRTDQ